MTTVEEFGQIMVIARKMCTYGPDFTDHLTVEAWYLRLKDFTPAQLGEAMTRLTGDREFPTINQIKNFISEKQDIADATHIEAFDLVWRKIEEVGTYGKPALPNEIGLAVQKLGGWKYICDSWSDTNRPFHQKAFDAVYSEVLDRKAKGLYLERSKYAPEALKGAASKALPPKANEALKMAVSASDKRRGNSLRERLRRMKKSLD